MTGHDLKPADWPVWEDPDDLLCEIQARASTRKLRLFAFACCRRIWRHLDPYSQLLLTHKEKQVDLMKVSGKHEAIYSSRYARQTLVGDPAEVSHAARAAVLYAINDPKGRDHARAADTAYMRIPEQPRELPIYMDELKAQAELLREIFGNPFRPITLDRSRLNATALAIAQAVYEERQFDRLPIMADALEEAGVVQPDLLNHCRQPGDHVRGCWALDLVLGRE